MSVVQVTNEKIYENGIPSDGGINDLRMGTMDKALIPIPMEINLVVTTLKANETDKVLIPTSMDANTLVYLRMVSFMAKALLLLLMAIHSSENM